MNYQLGLIFPSNCIACTNIIRCWKVFLLLSKINERQVYVSKLLLGRAIANYSEVNLIFYIHGRGILGRFCNVDGDAVFKELIDGMAGPAAVV